MGKTLKKKYPRDMAPLMQWSPYPGKVLPYMG